MKRLAWIIVLIVCVVAGGVAVWKRAERSEGAYVSYISTRLKVRLEYPSTGWKLYEEPQPQDRVVGSVQVFGPRRQDLKYSPYLHIAAESTSVARGAQPTLEDVVRAALTKRLQQRSYQIAEQTPMRCAGVAAFRVLADYALVLPLESVKSKAIPFRELSVHCPHDGKHYILTLAAPAEDFPKYQSAFDHLVKTLKFLP